VIGVAGNNLQAKVVQTTMKEGTTRLGLFIENTCKTELVVKYFLIIG
jgi:hypothetical protein